MQPFLIRQKRAQKYSFKLCERVIRSYKPTRFYWVTNPEINHKNLEHLMLMGTSRWKIENETFNTLKNQGYPFEHNYGHGKENLSSCWLS
jgi:arylamine N-acetyltransferase